MTNAEFIQEVRAEIENRLKECSEDTQFEGKRCIYKRILSFISDLKKSLPSKVVDAKWLENEIVNYSFNSVPNLSPPLMITADFARHFYELGCRHSAEKYDESEKPMHLEGLEEEAVNYCFDNGLNLSPRVATDFAHHFYELGCTRTTEKYDELEYNRQRAEESIPKDLEEASSKFATHTAPNGVSVEVLEEKLSFQEGAKWDREQIMKNAKDGWMDEEDVIILNDGTRIDLQPDYDKKPAFEFEYAQNVQVIVLPKEN